MTILSLLPAPRSAGAGGADACGGLEIHGTGSPGRTEVERFIRGVYRGRYRAEVREFAPVLLCRRDVAGVIVAAAGHRRADAGPLFLERYLDAPVEALLPRGRFGAPSRAGIVEVGHLAACRPGEGRRLILALGPYLRESRCEWVVGTLTQELRHLMVRMGIAPLTLGAADPSALGDGAAQWGSYYEHGPVVLAGRLGPALRQLARRDRLA